MTERRDEDMAHLWDAFDALRRDASRDDPVAERAIESLGTALEELATAFDELRTQNSELQRVRDELVYQEHRFQDLFHHAPEPYLVTDVRGIVRQANAAACRLLNVDEDRLSGRWLAIFLPRPQRPDFAGFLRNLGDAPASIELVVQPRDHAPVVVAAVVVPRRDDVGRGPERRWILRDVTDARRAQTALQEAFTRSQEETEELRDLDRWKDAFMAAAAHDLRSHIDAITLTGHILESEQELSAVPPLARSILTQASRLRRLLGDLLDLDRFTRGTVTAERAPTDLASLVDEVLQALPVDDHVIDVDVPHLVAQVDPGRTSQIVDNLIQNALRHTPEGTRIRVEARVVDDGIELAVEDDGPGIPPRLRDDVFRPFVTRRAHAGSNIGTGIGLSLVTLFAELHGGAARLEDGEAGGARLVVHLPARIEG